VSQILGRRCSTWEGGGRRLREGVRCLSTWMPIGFLLRRHTGMPGLCISKRRSAQTPATASKRTLPNGYIRKEAISVADTILPHISTV
jgi:hypothetical protein